MSEDPTALEELVDTYRSRGTPTIVIGSEVIIGFNRARIDQLIAQA